MYLYLSFSDHAPNRVFLFKIGEVVLLRPTKKVQWNPREVNTLEVNSRLKSTPDGGPDFFLVSLSNFISLKVNDIGPILG